MFKLPKPRASSIATLIGVATLAVVMWILMMPGSVPIALMENHASNTGLVASPFGTGVADAPIDSAAMAPPAITIKLVRQGRSRNGRAFATLRIDGGPPMQFVVGDVLARGVRLTRILNDSVELQRGMVFESLPMSGNQDVQSSLLEQPSNTANNGAKQAERTSAIESTPITAPIDQPPPSSNAVQRAIRRASHPIGNGGI